jgi:hypothetical protein
VNPTDNLALAKFLSGRPRTAPEEAAIRGSCGRAYYAAFGVTVEAMVAGKITVSSGVSVHRDVISLLKKSKDPDIRTCGGLLEQLFDTRISADYDVGSRKPRSGPFNDKRAHFAVGIADVVITAINKAGTKDRRLFIP